MGSATPRKRSTFAGLTLDLDEHQVIPLMCALAAAPYTSTTRALLEMLEASLPEEEVEKYKAAAVKHIEQVDRLYTEAVEKKIGNKIREAARAKAVPQIVGRQVGGSGLRYVERVREDGGFDYTPTRANAHVFPSRNQAHNAVRKRMASASNWGTFPGQETVVGKYTDFFTEPADNGLVPVDKAKYAPPRPLKNPLLPKRQEWGARSAGLAPVPCPCLACVKRRARMGS